MTCILTAGLYYDPAVLSQHQRRFKLRLGIDACYTYHRQTELVVMRCFVTPDQFECGPVVAYECCVHNLVPPC